MNISYIAKGQHEKDYGLPYPFNFRMEFSILDHCNSQQVQRFAKIRRIWSNFPILACTKAELCEHYYHVFGLLF